MKKIKKPLYKLITCLVLIAVIILTACGNKNDEAETEKKPIEYRMKTIEIPDSIIATDVVITDEAVYYLDNAGIIRIDYDGNTEKLFSLPDTEYFTCLFIDEESHFNVISNDFAEDGETVTGLTVRRFNSSGGTQSRTNLSPFAENEAFRHAVNFLIKDGYFYVQSMSGVYVYDMGGNLVYEALGDGDTFTKSLFVLEDGRVGSASSRFANNDASFIARVYDIGEQDFDEYQVSVFGSTQDAIITNGGATGLLLGDSTGLFEFGIRSDGTLDRSRAPLLSFLERGVNVGDIKDIHTTLDGDIIIILKHSIIRVGDILVFSEHGEAGTLTADGGWAPADLTDAGTPKIKEVVTLAIPEFGFMQTSLQLYIAEFNKTNPDYTIEVISYGDDNDTYLDEDALRRFSIAIGTGQVADIVVFPRRGVPIYSYTSKGLFVDLYELMENDPDFNKADYLPNVFEALETDGKLYTIFPHFMLWTYIGKASEVGEKPGWTIDEFIAYLDSKPEAQDIIIWMNREQFILNTSMNYFADRKTGRMTFDRDIFMKILQASERFPIEKIEYPDPDIGLWPQMGAKYGDPLMLFWLVSGGPDGGGFRLIQTLETYFGEEITYIGLPTPDGSGSFFMVNERFAISAQSDKKEGAWQFIKHLLDNFNTDWRNRTTTPIKISDLEMGAHAATLEEYNPHGDLLNRNIVIGGNIDDGLIYEKVDSDNTLEQNLKLWDLIFKTNKIESYDTVVRDIIFEEIRYYIAGQKPAETVMDIIENRVNLYLSELE